jgi:PAS domain S-box-containing protein
MKETIKILFVEDVPSDAELIWHQLYKDDISFEKVLVETKEDYISALETFMPDIIISDFSLPKFDGMTALILKNELAPHIPFILVTGSINEEIAVECMKSGADDYVIKQNLSRLVTSMQAAIAKKKVFYEKEMAEKTLRDSEEKLRSIFRVAPVGIGLIKNRVIQDVNKCICDMTGYSPEELIGHSAEMLYQTKEEFDFVGEVKYRQIEEIGTGSVETRWKRKDGRIIDIILSSTLISPNNKSHGNTFTVLDITNRKNAEEALKQKIDELERFNNLTVDRELRMIELKQEVNGLLRQIGLKEKYKIVE